ncbi:MAG TPA: GAF domain-containing protein [Fimbriimonadaceae bacterium]|nr:GAF domain-containing protein [Fimbriimonadaceae bacterium]
MISLADAKAFLADLEASELRGPKLRAQAMKMLSDLPGYDWCGVYRLEDSTLVVDEYVGAETEHTRIAVGVGVCGTAVAERQNQVVEDVRELTNYLSCSLLTRSEIVVLIRRGGDILGQIDVDGHQVGAFDTSDEVFLDRVAGLLAERWE